MGISLSCSKADVLQEEHLVEKYLPIECPLCYESTIDNINMCDEQHTQICKKCAISYITDKINSGYNGYCPILNCPICQLDKKNRTINYDIVTQIIGKEIIKKYEMFANSLTIIKCSGCHKQGSLLPKYDDIVSSLTSSIVEDVKFYENGVITADKFFNMHHQCFETIILKIQNPEKRMSLLLRYFKTNNIATTKCCDRLHCFNCKEYVSNKSHICQPMLIIDCLQCVICNATLTKADGCDTITCVCGYQFTWSDALVQYKKKTKILSMYENYKEKTKNPMSITKYFVTMLWHNKLNNDDLKLLQMWIVQNNMNIKFHKYMRNVLMKTDSIYYLHIFSNKYIKSKIKTNLDMFLSCMTSNEKSIVHMLIKSYEQILKTTNKYICFKYDMAHIHSILISNVSNSDTYSEIMQIFQDDSLRNNYNKYLKNSMINIGKQYLYLNGSKKLTNIMCKTNLSKSGEVDDCDRYCSTLNMMFIANTDDDFILDIKLARHHNYHIVCKNNVIVCNDNEVYGHEFEMGDIIQVHINTETNIFRIIINEFIVIQKGLSKTTLIKYNINKKNVLTKLKRDISIFTNFEQFRQFCMYLRLLKKITNGFKFNCYLLHDTNIQYTLSDVNKIIYKNFSVQYDILKNFTFSDMCGLALFVYTNRLELLEKSTHESIVKFVELYSDETMYTALLIIHGLIDVEPHIKKMAKLFICENKDCATQFYTQDENNNDPVFDVKSSCKCIPRHLNGFSGKCSNHKIKTLIITNKTFLQEHWIARCKQFTNSSIGIIRQDKVEVECKP